MERSDDIFAAFCDDLEGYIEGTLPDARRREMDVFLESSEEARALLAEFREADALFDDATWDVPPPKNLPTAQAILDAARPSPARSWNPFAWMRPSWVVALAGLIVVGGTTWVLLRSANQPKLETTAQRSPVLQEEKKAEEPISALSAPASSTPIPPTAAPTTKAAPSAPKEAARQSAATNESAAVKNLPTGPAPTVSVGGFAGSTAASGATTDGVSAASQPAPPPPADAESAKVVAKDKKADAETKTGEVVAVQGEGSTTRANAVTVAKPTTQQRAETAAGGAGKTETPLPPRSVTLEISVADLTTARSQVTLFVQQSGGSVNVPFAFKDNDADLLEIGARVPSDKALLVLKQLRGLGTVERETTVPSSPAKEARQTAEAASSRDDAPAPSTLRVKLRKKK